MGGEGEDVVPEPGQADQRAAAERGDGHRAGRQSARRGHNLHNWRRSADPGVRALVEEGDHEGGDGAAGEARAEGDTARVAVSGGATGRADPGIATDPGRGRVEDVAAEEHLLARRKLTDVLLGPGHSFQGTGDAAGHVLQGVPEQKRDVPRPQPLRDRPLLPGRTGHH